MAEFLHFTNFENKKVTKVRKSRRKNVRERNDNGMTGERRRKPRKKLNASFLKKKKGSVALLLVYLSHPLTRS